jgi:hypothetical protein
VTWIPRSRTENQTDQEAWLGPFEGIPDWLGSHIDDWIFRFFFGGTFGGIEHFNTEALRSIQLDLHLPELSRPGPRQTINYLQQLRHTDVDAYLDTVDWIVAHCRDDAITDELDSMLERASSSFVVFVDDVGLPRIAKRIDKTTEFLIRSSATPGSNASIHLSNSWSQVYGSGGSPSEAYGEAIKAVEAAAKPVVSPENERTTLGSIIRDLKARPDKWSFVIHPRGEDTGIQTIISMMDLIWTGLVARHGDDEAERIEATLQEAESALHTAAALVHFFNSGAISRIT